MCLVYYITILSNTAMIAFIEGGGEKKTEYWIIIKMVFISKIHE